MRSVTLCLSVVLSIVVGCERHSAKPLDLYPQANTDTETPPAMSDSPDEWQKLRDARLAALENEFGKSEESVYTSGVPIYLGGGSDVLTFKNHVDGVVYVTAGLIGDGGQKKTSLGQYELMMCFRSENDWAPSLLSRLAPSTFEVALNPGDTMDIGPAMPDESTIVSLLFVSYRQFKIGNIDAGSLLCIGITDSELKKCRSGGTQEVLSALKESGIYPFTDVKRESVVK